MAPSRIARVSTTSELDPLDYALDADLRARLLSPSLVIFLDHVRANLRTVIAQLDGDPGRWRPHIKTLKIPEIFRELLQAGVRHFKCATTREARKLAELIAAEGTTGCEILLAHPIQGPGVQQLAVIADEHSSIRMAVLVECPLAARAMPQVLGQFVDLNLGMDRTGIPLAAHESILEVAAAAGERLVGLHAYDGHRYEPDMGQREELLKDSYSKLAGVVQAVRTAGYPVHEVITAGTPAFLPASRASALRDLPDLVHRVSPGTVVFHDVRSSQQNPGLDLLPAAVLFTRVVSHPTPGRITCDAGSKSLAAEAGDPCAVVIGHPQLLALRPSEEHLPLAYETGEPLPRGTELLLVPRHVCPTVNLAEQALIIESGQAPRIVDVSARAHDLLYDH
jgi:D-serine deaminase-like pyridoxal phosphate-dependent protein